MKAPTTSPAIGTVAVVTIMAVILMRTFGGPDALAGVLFAAAAALALSGYRTTPLRLRQTAIALFVISALLLPLTQSPFEALQRGVFISGQLLAMLASVMLLAQCALRSARVQAVGASLRGQPSRRRYLTFTMASQSFAGILSMAGAHIMLVMAAPANEASSPDKTAAVVAVTRGFAAAGFWSPMFGNMVLMLALYPSLHWIDVFPIGLVVAQLTLAVGLLLNRLRRLKRFRHSDNSDPASTQVSAPDPAPVSGVAPKTGLMREAVPLIAAMLGFLGLILTTSGLLRIGITATLVLLAPLAALVVHLAVSDSGRRVEQTMRGFRDSGLLFPRLASEAMLFMAAGCAGSIMAGAFPVEWAQQIGYALDGMPFFAIGFLLVGIMAIALIGVHPVLTAVFLASTITPEILMLPPVVHMAAILFGWGFSTLITPLSVLSLTASRYSGTTLYQISMGKNWAFVLISTLLTCVVLTLVTMIVD
jgi:hypothetical protein